MSNHTGDGRTGADDAHATLVRMAIARLTVFLPCHTLDDFPTWLDEVEADDLLAAWTAAWEPCLVATVGAVPGWASIDLPPHDDGGLLGIVPAAFADRFASPDAAGDPDRRFIERTSGRAAITAAAIRAVGIATSGTAPGAEWSEDFRALGLAVLVTEVLSRRMRTTSELDATAFGTTAVAAARAALEGDGATVRERLRECWGFLECCRARYYPADIWLLDLVLIAASSPSSMLVEALDSQVPMGVVVEAESIARLATTAPDFMERLRGLVADGRGAVLGGRHGARPLDLCTPEEVVESFAAGREIYDAAGVTPAVFARLSGGATPLLPQVLAGGFAGMVWPLFDGTPLPDPHAGRIRWEGCGGTIEAVARPPLDARNAITVVGLPERLGDVLDHDHVAVLTFAHFAGTCGEWHRLIRRIGSWSAVLGTFVTPEEFFRRSGDGGSHVRFEADAFPVTLPGAPSPGRDAVGAALEEAVTAARATRSAAAGLDPLLVRPSAGGAAAPTHIQVAAPPRGWRPWRRRGSEHPLIDNGVLRVTVHRETGGILSVRRPSDRANRLSQQVAVRWPGSGGAEPGYSRMRADVIEEGSTGCGERGLVARGRLVDGDGDEIGRFTQGVSLVPGLPLALIDIDLALARPLAGAPLDRYAASRFAWSENDDLEVRRSLHTQSVPTDREAFTAPHFIELRPAGLRAGDTESVTILTGGMPWHLLASPHILDAVLLGGGGEGETSPGTCTRRLGIGVGLNGVGDKALALVAGRLADVRVTPWHPTVRVTVDSLDTAAGRPRRARVGLLESAGRTGDVRLEWTAEPRQAVACDARGTPRGSGDTASAHVAIDGRATIVFLRAFEWLHVEVEFTA